MPIYVVENDYSEDEPSSADSDDAETLQEWNKIQNRISILDVKTKSYLWIFGIIWQNYFNKGFSVSPKSRKRRKSATKKKMICTGRGCRCGTAFATRKLLLAHYMERQCYKCKKCDLSFQSGRLRFLKWIHSTFKQNCAWVFVWVDKGLK